MTGAMPEPVQCVPQQREKIFIIIIMRTPGPYYRSLAVQRLVAPSGSFSLGNNYLSEAAKAVAGNVSRCSCNTLTDERNVVKARCELNGITSHFIVKGKSTSDLIEFGSGNLVVMFFHFQS